MGLKKSLKGVMGGSKLWVGGSAVNALFDPGRLAINTKAEEAAAEQAKQAAAERAMYETQQRQLQEANTLDASKVLDNIARVETGAGTDVAVDDTALGTKKKRNQSVSTSLGVQ